MKRIEAAQIAGAVAQVSNVGLSSQKGLRLYRFYRMLKAIQSEIAEYEHKLRANYGIGNKDNDKELIRQYNEALEAICNEEITLDVEPFLTEEECMEILGNVLTMEGMAIIMPIITCENL